MLTWDRVLEIGAWIWTWAQDFQKMFKGVDRGKA
jgi:hypothetical protein